MKPNGVHCSHLKKYTGYMYVENYLSFSRFIKTIPSADLQDGPEWRNGSHGNLQAVEYEEVRKQLAFYIQLLDMKPVHSSKYGLHSPRLGSIKTAVESGKVKANQNYKTEGLFTPAMYYGLMIPTWLSHPIYW